MKKHHLLILLWLFVSLYGAVMEFSATYINTTIYGGNPFLGLVSQFVVILIVGGAGTVFFHSAKIDTYQLMKRFAKPVMIITVGALAFVAAFGGIRGGARMVIPLGPFDFQPMEMFKISAILYFAYQFSNVKPSETLVDSVTKLFLPIIGIGLVILQPDFGGAMIILIVLYWLLIINGQNLKQLILLAVGGSATIIFAVMFLLKEYQRARIFMWLNPFNDAAGSGWQLINSYVAISNGGLLGSGYMSSVQKAGFLSQPGSDFIFAIICEELGLIGALLTIGLLVSIAVVVISIGNTAHERFGMLYCYGFAMLLLTQTFINVGGVTGVIPMTGVTLPFISTGINSYLFMSLGVFLTVPISRIGIKEKKRERKTTNFKG